MIISKTPFRVSLFGGGTDYPEWYNDNNGKVINFAINKYCYINLRELPPFFNYLYRIKYHKIEYCKKLSHIKHPSVRACFEMFKINNADLTHSADLPAFSGLGSSSSFTVGLINAITFKKKSFSKEKLFKQAIEIERNILNEPVGCQDQTIASIGGFNAINFTGKNRITINSLTKYKKNIDLIKKNLVMIYTGIPRFSFKITSDVILNMPNKNTTFKRIYEIAVECENLIKSENFRIDDISALLNETWKLKKETSNKVSNNKINQIYEAGINYGADAGKLLGGGGGGFVLFFVKPKNREFFLNKLKSLMYIPLDYDYNGSVIIQKSKNVI